MIRSLLFLFAFVFLAMALPAQTNVQLNIHHKLGNEGFEFEKAVVNSLQHDLYFTRVQYYISGITILHDGGLETSVPDVYILADAGTTTTADLGDFNITTVEGIRFYTGVDPDHNHLDPAAYPVSHPLAPQFPSMHWGWASGYRFAALEGKGGSSFNQTFELHGLGDANYFETEVTLSATAENNAISIDLDADYIKTLEKIGVAGGIIVHGDNGTAKQMLENFRDYVFSASSSVSSTPDPDAALARFEVFPNPAQVGTASVLISADNNSSLAIAVTDILGRPVQYINNISVNTTLPLQITEPGIYLVQLIRSGQPAGVQKLIVR